ncbi:hypothetical protein C2845_PM03G31030 [Panicum miliaceum]|uniref:SIAH-type domain-containing protein n=1 Tax=Panicum miliaceum TaxID=4540 RepID=A0A3L6T9W6_PANMI|nr:hypothetical protein C2845_PM03G31030 [Panicum miliaceum]
MVQEDLNHDLHTTTTRSIRSLPSHHRRLLHGRYPSGQCSGCGGQPHSRGLSARRGGIAVPWHVDGSGSAAAAGHADLRGRRGTRPSSAAARCRGARGGVVAPQRAGEPAGPRPDPPAPTPSTCSPPGPSLRLASMLAPCAFAEHGCTRRLRFTEKPVHEALLCQRAPCACPVPGCAFSGLELRDHIQDAHAAASGSDGDDGAVVSFAGSAEVTLRHGTPFRVLLHETDARVFLLLNGGVSSGRSLSVVCVGPRPGGNRSLEYTPPPRSEADDDKDDSKGGIKPEEAQEAWKVMLEQFKAEALRCRRSQCKPSEYEDYHVGIPFGGIAVYSFSVFSLTK